MHEAIDARLDLHEQAEVCRADDRAAELRSDRIAIADVRPRIGFLIFHGQRDALAVVLDLDHLHAHLLTDCDHVLRIGDAAAAHL